MQLTRHPGNPILSKNQKHVWEAGSVLNPSVLFDNGIYRMVYRATNDINQEKAGGYVSSIGYAESRDGIHFTRFERPLIVPDQAYEQGLGCEDPRVTKIEGQYFLYYTAVRGIGEHKEVRIALATSRDFKTWQKHGIVGPSVRSKAACLFPEKIHGTYIMLYTLRSDSPESSIMQVVFETLDAVKHPSQAVIDQTIADYDTHVVFRPPQNTFRGAEVGAVPIKTDAGWLFIYCGANISNHPEWTISAALLDLENPKKVLSQTENPLLKPETKDELQGVVNNVTFPQGAVKVGEELYVYYGSGDQGICLATCNFNDLLKHLHSQKK